MLDFIVPLVAISFVVLFVVPFLYGFFFCLFFPNSPLVKKMEERDE